MNGRQHWVCFLSSRQITLTGLTNAFADGHVHRCSKMSLPLWTVFFSPRGCSVLWTKPMTCSKCFPVVPSPSRPSVDTDSINGTYLAQLQPAAAAICAPRRLRSLSFSGVQGGVGIWLSASGRDGRETGLSAQRSAALPSPLASGVGLKGPCSVLRLGCGDGSVAWMKSAHSELLRGAFGHCQRGSPSLLPRSGAM